MLLPVRSILEILRYYPGNSIQASEVQNSSVILGQWRQRAAADHSIILIIPPSLASAQSNIMVSVKIIKRLYLICNIHLNCTYFTSAHSFVLQICPRIASQKSPQKCVCLPPSSRSTSTTTASSASQKPLSIYRC